MICDGLKESLKICVVTSTYPRTEDDYAVPWLRESIRRFVDRGHSVHVLAPSFEGLGNHAIDGVQVERFRYSPRQWERLTHEQGAPNRIRNPWYQLLGLPYVVMGCRAARHLARQHSFDVVHAHWPFPHEPIASAAAVACGASLVITSHGAEFALARRKAWVRPILRHSLRKADALIANSSDTAKHIHAISGFSAEILPFGSTVHPKSVVEDTDAVPRVLFTGRLIQRKGVEFLLRAIPRVLAMSPAKFIITGDGDERANLESLAASLELGDAVEFLGFVSNERLNKEYGRCNVWVNPSVIDDRGDTEGLGVGAIEAYMHGKPVVASAVGGIPDAVRNGTTGWLVPEKDTAALANAILDLVKDPAKARKFGEAGLRFAEQRFDWERITDRLEQIYYATTKANVATTRRPFSASPPRNVEYTFSP
jgi:glycosyltransferase involved in cell wall biosynthesis